MVVRDILHSVPEERIIARAIYEDRCEPQDTDIWITKYYAQLVKLKSSKIRKSDMMFYLSVVVDEDITYGDVSGFSYDDIKAGNDIYYGIEGLNYRQYASLYVPDYTVQLYGEEVVASEALREYGWNGFDDSIVCPDDTRLRVLQALEGMKHELFTADKNYYDRCRRQFRKAYEGKKVPQWGNDECDEASNRPESQCSESLCDNKDERGKSDNLDEYNKDDTSKATHEICDSGDKTQDSQSGLISFSGCLTSILNDHKIKYKEIDSETYQFSAGTPKRPIVITIEDGFRYLTITASYDFRVDSKTLLAMALYVSEYNMNNCAMTLQLDARFGEVYLMKSLFSVDLYMLSRKTIWIEIEDVINEAKKLYRVLKNTSEGRLPIENLFTYIRFLDYVRGHEESEDGSNSEKRYGIDDFLENKKHKRNKQKCD